MSYDSSGLTHHLPLTPTVFQILLSLADGPLHGYAIMQQVNGRVTGKVAVGPGTLYGAIQRMQDSGLLSESAAPPGEKAEPRRRYYAMTDLGRRALLAEADRLEDLVARVRAKSLGTRPAG